MVCIVFTGVVCCQTMVVGGTAFSSTGHDSVVWDEVRCPCVHGSN